MSKVRNGKSESDSTHGDVGGSVVFGNVKIGDEGKFIGRDDYTQNTEIDLTDWFLVVYDAIAVRPNTSAEERKRIENAIKGIQVNVGKETIKKSFVKQRLINLSKMAPDIWEIIVAMFSNPIPGLGVAATKIVKKLAEEAKQNESKE